MLTFTAFYHKFFIYITLSYMKRLLYTLLFLSTCISVNYAQQDPTFTNYNFNPLVYNPAIAGTEDHLTIAALYRQQWIGIEGGPNTALLSMHTPVVKNRVGVGLTLLGDRIGPTEQMGLQGSFSYRFKVGGGYLAFGMSAGALNWRSNWNDLKKYDYADPSFMTDQQPNYWLPNFGTGILYKHPNFFAGFSVPHIVEFDLGDKGITNQYIAKQYRHYLLTAGTQFNLNPNLQFKPYFVLNSVGLFERKAQSVSSPSTLYIDGSLLFFEAFQVGAGYRFAVESKSANNVNSDALAVWLAYKIKQSLRLGASYDFPLNSIGLNSKGSYQLMVSYEFYNEVTKVEPPRVY